MQTVVEKLIKTRNSANAHIKRTNGGYGPNGLNRRSLELIDRYDDLKAKLTKVGGHSSPEWRAYCERIGADVSHNGYDLFG